MGTDFTPSFAADLLQELPNGARIWKELAPAKSVSETVWLMQVIDFRLQVLAWQQSKDGQKNKNQPKPPEMPGFKQDDEKFITDIDTYKELLSRKRE